MLGFLLCVYGKRYKTAEYAYYVYVFMEQNKTNMEEKKAHTHKRQTTKHYLNCFCFHKHGLSAADQMAPLQDLHSISEDFTELDRDLKFVNIFNSSNAFMVLLASGAIIGTVCLATITYYVTTDWLVEPARKLYRTKGKRRCCGSGQSTSVINNDEDDFLLTTP